MLKLTLTASAVNHLLAICTAPAADSAVTIVANTTTFIFDPYQLKYQKDPILQLYMQIPKTCRNDCNSWSSFQDCILNSVECGIKPINFEGLIALCMAAGLVEYSDPKEFWST